MYTFQKEISINKGMREEAANDSSSGQF